MLVCVVAFAEHVLTVCSELLSKLLVTEIEGTKDEAVLFRGNVE